MKTDYDIQAEKFLADNGLKLRITLSDSKEAPWEVAGHHYRVTLSRNAPQWRGGPQDNFQPKRVVFDFWGSHRDMQTGEEPSAYDVLACIGSDIHTPETFEEFCADYGYESDSIKALQTFRRADRFAKRLRAFFTDSEVKQLSEIR